jgi:hypothetical protein
MTVSGMMCLQNDTARRTAMERFVKRHQGHIKGVLSGFDRVLFRGTLRSLSYCIGLDKFLGSQRVLYKNFGEFAEKLSSRIKTHAQAIASKHGRPYQYLESAKWSKHDIARNIMERDNIKQGLVCVLSCVEVSQSFRMRKNSSTKKLDLLTHLRPCLHLYFYYVDRDFGLMHVRLQTWLPFTMQVCINGREWLARQMDRAGVEYVKRDNCFTHIEDISKAQELMNKLSERNWTKFLNALSSRLNPLINKESGLNLRGYYWSIRECEYATDVMFKDAESLGRIYPALIQHAMLQFSTKNVLRFLGRRVKTTRFEGEVTSDFVERAEGVRIKHWVEENSIKMYDKQGSVLRIETTINSPRRFKVRRRATRYGKSVMAGIPMRKGVVDTRRRVQLSRAANERYLEALAVVGEPTPSHQLLDPVSRRQTVDGRKYRALKPISQEDSRVFRAVLKGEFLIQGFRNRDLREYLEPNSEGESMSRRKASARVSRLLRLLRAHGLIYKVPKTNYHRITKSGQQVMTTATKFRDTDIALLAAA